MKHRIVRLICPSKSQDRNLISFSTSKVPFIKKYMTIYGTVDFFEKNLFSKIKMTNKQVSNQVRLREIINLHNSDGVREISQITSMFQQINSGKDVLMPSKLPNIKLVKTEKNEFVLFDGHHSLLAYMASGRKYLSEIPHLVVENEDGYATNKEILVFFGSHSKKLEDRNWRNYVINWQAQEEKQLCKRIQKNMGELLKSIMAYL